MKKVEKRKTTPANESALPPIASVGLVGLGAIGGSLAKALTAAGVPIRAWSNDPADVQSALDFGIDAAEWNADTKVADLDTWFIAVPVDAIADVARQILGARSKARCFHVGGLQRPDAIKLPKRLHDRVIGTHPLAGTHLTGFTGSDPDLFNRRIVLAESRADEETRERIEELWEATGACVEYMDAEVHDGTMSWVSHLPQLGAVALAATLAENTVDPNRLGPGALDATRLAMSSLMAWRPLLDAAPADTAQALGALERTVGAMRRALEEGDQEIISEFWQSARKWRNLAEQGGGSSGAR